MAQRFVKNLEACLCKVQTDNETEATGLAATDLLEVMRDSSFNYEQEGTEIMLVSNSFDQEKYVPGIAKVNWSIKCPLRNFGVADAGVPPDFGALLQAMDFTEIANNSYYQYVPNSTGGSSVTLWGYYGRAGGTTNLLKGYNIKGSGKLSLEAGKIGTLEFNGMGAFSDFTTGTFPTVSRNRTLIPAVLSATVTINGSSYKFIIVEIDFGQESDNDIDASETYGVGQSNITDRKFKFNAKVYADLQTTLDPIAALQGASEGSLVFNYGSTPEIKIASSYSQITAVAASDQNGKTTWDLSGQLNRNDLRISILGADSSSSSSSSS